jgi:hypothetical protein
LIDQPTYWETLQQEEKTLKQVTDLLDTLNKDHPIIITALNQPNYWREDKTAQLVQHIINLTGL